MQTEKLFPITLSGLLFGVLLLGGCASTPVFETQDVALDLTPAQALQKSSGAVGERVVWGGTILDIRNLQDVTQLEVLGFPLSDSFRPQTAAAPLGRFLIRQRGFLEPQDYAQGRKLTVLGKLEEVSHGRIGEADYEYPVVEAEKLQLWPERDNKTRFYFGFGLRL